MARRWTQIQARDEACFINLHQCQLFQFHVQKIDFIWKTEFISIIPEKNIYNKLSTTDTTNQKLENSSAFSSAAILSFIVSVIRL